MSDQVVSPEDAERIVTHMNEEHPGDLVRYAEVYADMSDVQGARMTGIDAEGIDLVVETDGETRPVRIDFEMRLETVDEARSRLVELAMTARKNAEQ